LLRFDLNAGDLAADVAADPRLVFEAHGILFRMLISWAVVLVALVGLLLLAIAEKPKVVTIGTVMFLCGLMATCFLLAGRSVRIG
jgi:hypothetical protein